MMYVEIGGGVSQNYNKTSVTLSLDRETTAAGQQRVSLKMCANTVGFLTQGQLGPFTEIFVLVKARKK